MADKVPVVLHDEGEVGDKFRPLAVAVEHIMLGAPRAIDIPEGFTGEKFHLAVILGLFQTNVHGIIV